MGSTHQKIKGKVGLQLFTLRSILKTPEEIKDTLKKVKAIGYDVVQVAGLGPIDVKELKGILSENKLYPCSVHVGYDALLKETDRILEESKLMGYEMVICAVLPKELRSVSGFKKAAKELTKIGEYFFKNNILLGYHNHAFELEKFKDKTFLEILFEESDPKYLKAEIDTYWIQYGGGDPASWILKYKERVFTVHLKDYGIRENSPIMLEVLEGNLNWKSIFNALKEANTKWYIVEQDNTNEKAPLESVKISLNNIKKFEGS